MTKSVTCPEELGGLASQVTVDYGQLTHQGRLAAATAEPEEVRGRSLCIIEDVVENHTHERLNTCALSHIHLSTLLRLEFLTEILAQVCILLQKSSLVY